MEYEIFEIGLGTVAVGEGRTTKGEDIAYLYRHDIPRQVGQLMDSPHPEFLPEGTGEPGWVLPKGTVVFRCHNPAGARVIAKFMLRLAERMEGVGGPAMSATEQEFVEGYWQHTDLVSDGKDRHWVIVGTAALNPDGLRKALACRDSKPAAWSAAAEYTREHQRKVAELMEEIAWADDKAPFVRLFQDLSVPLKEYDVPVRLLNRLESALAELLKGVRQ